MSQWFYRKAGMFEEETVGPVDIHEMRERIFDGTIKQKTLVNNGADWLPAARLLKGVFDEHARNEASRRAARQTEKEREAEAKAMRKRVEAARRQTAREEAEEKRRQEEQLQQQKTEEYVEAVRQNEVDPNANLIRIRRELEGISISATFGVFALGIIGSDGLIGLGSSFAMGILMFIYLIVVIARAFSS